MALVPSSTSQALKDALEGEREGGRDHAVHLTGLNGLYGSGLDSCRSNGEHIWCVV